jgi:hypothetical protein
VIDIWRQHRRSKVDDHSDGVTQLERAIVPAFDGRRSIATLENRASPKAGGAGCGGKTMVCGGIIVQNSNMTVRDPKAGSSACARSTSSCGELYKTVLSDPPQGLCFAQGFRERVRQHRLELARLRSYRSGADPRHSAGVAEDVVIPQRTTRRPSSRNEFSTEA